MSKFPAGQNHSSRAWNPVSDIKLPGYSAKDSLLGIINSLENAPISTSQIVDSLPRFSHSNTRAFYRTLNRLQESHAIGSNIVLQIMVKLLQNLTNHLDDSSLNQEIFDRVKGMMENEMASVVNADLMGLKARQNDMLYCFEMINRIVKSVSSRENVYNQYVELYNLYIEAIKRLETKKQSTVYRRLKASKIMFEFEYCIFDSNYFKCKQLFDTHIPTNPRILRKINFYRIFRDSIFLRDTEFALKLVGYSEHLTQFSLVKLLNLSLKFNNRDVFTELILSHPWLAYDLNQKRLQLIIQELDNEDLAIMLSYQYPHAIDDIFIHYYCHSLKNEPLKDQLQHLKQLDSSWVLKSLVLNSPDKSQLIELCSQDVGLKPDIMTYMFKKHSLTQIIDTLPHLSISKQDLLHETFLRKLSGMSFASGILLVMSRRISHLPSDFYYYAIKNSILINNQQQIDYYFTKYMSGSKKGIRNAEIEKLMETHGQNWSSKYDRKLFSTKFTTRFESLVKSI